MQAYYNPFTIRTLDNGWKCLIVKTKNVIQHPSVNDLLTKRFGSFSMFQTIPKSKLYFCHQDKKLNLYQISLIHGVCTIHVLRMYDESRLDQDIDSIISSIRDTTPIQSYVTLSVYMYLPYMMNVDVASILKVFRPSGQKEADIHGNTLYNRTKLYTCKWPLRHNISNLAPVVEIPSSTTLAPSAPVVSTAPLAPIPTTTMPAQPAPQPILPPPQNPTTTQTTTAPQTTFPSFTPPTTFGTSTPSFAPPTTTTQPPQPPSTNVFGNMTFGTTTNSVPSFGNTTNTLPSFGTTANQSTPAPAIFNTSTPAFTMGSTAKK